MTQVLQPLNSVPYYYPTKFAWINNTTKKLVATQKTVNIFTKLRNINSGEILIINKNPKEEIFSPSNITLTINNKKVTLSNYLKSLNIPSNKMEKFFNYLYIKALIENPKLTNIINSYNYFIDNNYNSSKNSITPIKPITIYKSLQSQNLLNEIVDFGSFIKLTEHS